MKLFFHFTSTGRATTYLFGPDGGGDAVLVDPGSFDTKLLTVIEQNHFTVSAVLFTHSHENHTGAIGTIRKIYSPILYGNQRSVFGFDVNTISGHEWIDICSFHIEATPIPGHSSDSLVYRIGNLLFTGDTLLSGRIGTAPNAYARDLLIKAICRSLLPLPGETIILTGHGPPSLISMEKRFNPFLSGKYVPFPERTP